MQRNRPLAALSACPRVRPTIACDVAWPRALPGRVANAWTGPTCGNQLFVTQMTQLLMISHATEPFPSQRPPGTAHCELHLYMTTIGRRDERQYRHGYHARRCRIFGKHLSLSWRTRVTSYAEVGSIINAPPPVSRRKWECTVADVQHHAARRRHRMGTRATHPAVCRLNRRRHPRRRRLRRRSPRPSHPPHPRLRHPPHPRPASQSQGAHP